MVGMSRIELPTYPLSGDCSTTELHANELVPQEGIEPSTFALQERCSTTELLRRKI